ncbi:MAG: hypothetical protein P8R54_11265 [Myxococcota bacterium]|nr:hypothetical protein [Myxococcota bacterium]
MTTSLTPIAPVMSPRAAHLDDFWRDVSAIIALDEVGFTWTYDFFHL